MLELIILIVVVGIIASISLPNTNGTDLTQASHQVINHIRYVQHLAMVENKYTGSEGTSVFIANARKSKATKYWYNGYWQIKFWPKSKAYDFWRYSLFTDFPENTATHATYDKQPHNRDEVLIDQATQKALSYKDSSHDYNKDNKLNLTKSYGVEKIKFSNNCKNSNRLLFDYYGTPYCKELGRSASSITSAYDYQLNRIFKITFFDKEDESGDNISVCVEPYSGYVHYCDS